MIKSKTQELPEFDNHAHIYDLQDFSKHLHGYIAIHRCSDLRPAFGATRLWNYKSKLDALRDVLRLSKGMSYKSALAGLPYGGAKAVIIAQPKTKQSRNRILREYANVVNKIRGQFITGIDVGLTNADITFLKTLSPYFVGINVDPAKYTSCGIFLTIKQCFKLFGKGYKPTLSIQGIGKIGTELIKLANKDFEITACDKIHNKEKEVVEKFPNVRIVSTSSIYESKSTIFAPCALGGTINASSIKKIKSPFIIGGANNQLEDEQIGDKLFKKKILYAPDYIVNAGGLISVVSEYERGGNNHTAIMNQIKKIPNRVSTILKRSLKNNIPPNRIASEMAEKIFNQI